MLLGLFAVSASAEAEKGIYVYMGDSMSFNFGQRHEWSAEVKKNYPTIIAEEKGYTINESLAIGGVRSTDVYSLLTDYAGDVYTDSQYNFDAKDKTNCQSAVESASLISLMLGYSNFSVQFLGSVATMLGFGDLLGADFLVDFNDILSKDEIEKLMPFAIKIKDLAEATLGENTLTAFRQYLAQQNIDVNEKLTTLFGEDVMETLTALSGTVDGITNAFLYAVISHIIHFDLSVEAIRSLNETAPIYVLGLFNPASQIAVSFTLGENTYVLPIGEAASVIFDMLNLYMRVLSPHSTEYYFVENAHHLETYGEKMAYDADLTEDILFAMITDNWDKEISPEAAALAKTLTPGATKIVGNTTFDLNEIISSIPEDVGSLFDNLDDDALLAMLEKYAAVDADGNLTSTAFEQTLAHLYFALALKGLYVHPTQAAHDEMGRRMLAAMDNPTIDADAVAYHKKLATFEDIMNVLNGADTFDEILSVLSKEISPANTGVTLLLDGIFSAVKNLFKANNIFDIITKIVTAIRNLFAAPIVG